MTKGIKGFQIGNQYGKLCKGKVPWNKGKHNIYNEKTKKEMGDARRGIIVSEETKNKMSKSWNPNKHLKNHTEEAKQKMRISAIEYIKNKRGAIFPNVGKYEKKILDELQNKLGFSIKRQFYINGYFLDGYCQELNLAIELDEKHHYKKGILNEHDLDKQNNIIKALNCDFMRIKVCDVINNNQINSEVLTTIMRTH